jgi:hypothetical protein
VSKSLLEKDRNCRIRRDTCCGFVTWGSTGEEKVREEWKHEMQNIDRRALELCNNSKSWEGEIFVG